MTLSLVILNYKTKGLLRQCLQGIMDANLPVDHEVIVVDNASHDGSTEMVREQFPQVRYISHDRNVGFGAGMNIGLRAAAGDYLLILNPDVAVFSAAVVRLLEYIRRHPKVGIAAPKLINPDGTTQWSCYQFPDWFIPILRRTPLGRLPWARRRLRAYLMSDWAHDANRPVGWALGACLLIRRDAMREIGLFDERFFLYFEDVDLCRRAWQAGWEVHYVAEADMVHYHQRMSAGFSGLSVLFAYPTRIHIRSGLKYFAKYLGAPPPPHL